MTDTPHIKAPTKHGGFFYIYDKYYIHIERINKMEKNLTEVEKPKRKAGGAQPGSGRPKGSTSKISSLAILAEIQKSLGKSFQEQLAENYKNALMEGNQKYIVAYDNIIINKCVTTAIEVDLTVTESDAVISKELAFAAALKAFSDKDTNE